MTVFGSDPWWIVLIKVVFVFAFLLIITIFNVWYERRLVGKMQQRKGPIMNGPFGLGQALGDGLKLMFKEDFRPTGRTSGSSRSPRCSPASPPSRAGRSSRSRARSTCSASRPGCS
jgi:hypothetical protein